MNHNLEQKIYTCPMHSEVQKDTPGICPECGMNLIQQKYESRSMNHEYDKHAGHSTAAFLKKFWINLALTIPVVAYSDIVQKVFNWSPPAFYGSAYIPLIFGSIVFFYGGWVFILGAYKEIRAKLPGMMTLIALAISAAYLYSVYVELSGPAFVEATAGKHPLFWELTTLITVMLLGHWIEMKAVSGAQSALRELSKLLPDTAEIIVNHESGITNHSNTKTISLSELKIGEHTFLAGVMRLVAEAQASKSRLQILSDRAAFYLTIIAIAAGSLTFVLWIVAQAGFSFAVERLVAVLVIACPHALGLAVPLVASISTTMAARNGFLVRQRLALEAARKIDIVLFDKTGTLTKGEYGVQKIWSVGEETENGILELAASVDAHSEHFISRAIVSDANKKGLPLFEVKDFQRIPGKGVRGIVDSKEVMAGGLQILEDNKITPSETLAKEISEENKKGKTIIFVLKDKKLIGAIALADIIREESREALSELKTMGVKTAMITGDSEDVAKWVADELGIDECFARVLPGEKSEKVKILQQKGLKVSMVGDGINDAPALTQADLGIAIGAGTNVAIESAGIILVRNDPRDIVKIIKLSQATYSKMIQNLFWATGYNVIALPLAAGVLASRGIILQPALAALFMSLSTVIVAVNAVLLRRKVL